MSTNLISDFLKPQFSLFPSKPKIVTDFSPGYYHVLTPMSELGVELPRFECSLERCDVCIRCGYFLSSFCSVNPVKSEWTCALCGRKNFLGSAANSSGITSTQNLDMGDIFREQDISKRNLTFYNNKHIIFIELSSIVHSTGFLHAFFTEIQNFIEDTSLRMLGIVFFSDSFVYPMINNNRTSFSICHSDISSPAFTVTSKMMFDLENERDIMVQYLQSVKQIPITGTWTPFSNVLRQTQSLLSQRSMRASYVVSSTPFCSFNELEEEALSKIRYSHSVSVYLLQDTYTTDDTYSQCSEYFILTNSRLRTFRTGQIPSLIFELLDNLVSCYFQSVTVEVLALPSIPVKDITGRGIRTAQNSFEMAGVSTGDSLYIEFDLHDTRTPFVPFQYIIKGYTPEGISICRVINMALTVSSDRNQLLASFDPQVYFSSLITKVQNQWRESSQETVITVGFQKILASLGQQLKDNKLSQRLMKHLLSLSDAHYTVELFGSSCSNLMRFFAPDVFLINKDGSIEPCLPGMAFNTVIVAATFNSTGLLLLPTGEDKDIWKEYMNSNSIGQHIKSLCDARYVEVRRIDEVESSELSRIFMKIVKSSL